MTVDLTKVVCPRTHRPLRPLEAGRLAALNAAVQEGRVRSVASVAVETVFDNALIVEGDEHVYRIEEGIPILLPDEAILLPEGV